MSTDRAFLLVDGLDCERVAGEPNDFSWSIICELCLADC
jgi:hypothetical protein